MMAAKEVLRTDVTPGALQSSAGLEGKVAAHDVYADQQVVSQVFRTPTDQAAALSLDKTERGIRVNVDFASGALGAIKAGDHVDYFATFAVKPPGDTAGQVFFTRRLMTDVRVLEAPTPDPESRPGQALRGGEGDQGPDPDAGRHAGGRDEARVRRGPKKGDGAAVVTGSPSARPRARPPRCRSRSRTSSR